MYISYIEVYVSYIVELYVSYIEVYVSYIEV